MRPGMSLHGVTRREGFLANGARDTNRFLMNPLNMEFQILLGAQLLGANRAGKIGWKYKFESEN